LAFVLVMTPATTLSAATLTQRNRDADEKVAEALRDETKDANAHHDGLLFLALEQAPDHAPARWHSGYVQQYGKWLRFDELPELNAKDTRYAAYRIARDKAKDTVEDQLALADWCAKRKMPDQERAHLTKVLALDPNQADARRRLGFRQVNGAWLSEQESAEADREAQQTAAAIKEWSPRLVEIRDGLLHSSEQRRKAAEERLRAINDPVAVAAIEVVFCRHSETMAHHGVAGLAGIPGHEASLALARQAVYSPSETVRQAAAEKLKDREMFGYVPAMLSAISGQIQGKAGLYTAPNGRLVYRHTFVREGHETNEVSVFETEYRNTVLSGESPAEIAASRQALNWQRQMDAAMKAQALELNVAQQNAAIQQLNGRVCQALAVATGAKLEATPDAWWKWWNERNEVFYPDGKPVRAVYRRTEVAYADPLSNGYQPATPSTGPTQTEVSPASLSRARYECLVAGTSVWTDAGPVPIERILPGDRVLAQDAETGELAYKPVLRTTIRAKGPLVKIRADEATIRSSGGHPFWVSGRGWVKARDLLPGMPLHAVDGTLQVYSVEDGGAEQTYNLIVADFHTYFASEAMVLSHDNTIRQPTNAIVPGLAGR
jgi:hypothetical protein